MKKTKPLTQEYAQSRLTQEGGSDYLLVGKYLNADTYLTIKHLPCGELFSTTLGLFKAGRRCPRCEQEKNNF